MVTRSGDIKEVESATTRADESGLEVRTSSGFTSADERSSVAKDQASDSGGTDQIRAKIEETRADMGETIDAIQERLSFANISDQVSEQVSSAIETVKDTAYDATIGRVVELMKKTGNGISNSPVIQTVKENPLPFILIGAGAGLLAYEGFSQKKRRSGQGDQRQYLTAESRTADGIDTSMARQAVRTARETVSNAAETAYKTVSRAAEDTYAGAGELASQAYEKAGNIGIKAQETYENTLEQRPWAIGVVALAAGAAVGMAIPRTRYENELMGETRASLINRVQGAAEGFVDRPKQAATEAGRNLSDEAKSLAEDAIG